MKRKNIALIVVLVIILGTIVIIQNNTKVGTTETLASKDSSVRVQEKSKIYQPAIELVNPNGYINTDNISIKENIGKKVILVDFWTYSCVNCQRTLPYLESWYEKYKDQGLVIIGVHTPEFAFEKEYDNVQRAVEKYGIKYPVVLDNDYKTWRAYKNQYWPRKYLIDIDGFIVYDHIGEGGYEETEKKIQELLEERAQVLGEDNNISENLTKEVQENREIGTPELYLGYKFYRTGLGNSEGFKPEQVVNYSLPEEILPNTFNFEGSWKNNEDNMELVSDTGKIVLYYYAKEANIVAGGDSNINVSVDGTYLSNIHVNEQDLYNVANLESSGIHTLEINATKGFKIYTFTFG